MTTLLQGRPQTSRIRNAWREAHDAVPGVPPWARTAAYLVPFLVLPSSLWRVVVVFLAPADSAASQAGDLPAWLPIEVYVVTLSVFSELLAFSAVGLVATWGECFPRGTPGLAGKRVPVSLAAVPAALGGAVLTLVSAAGIVSRSRGRTIAGEPLPEDFPLHFRDVEGVVSVVCYAPLALWGPLLLALTVAYVRRRRRG
jgi:hypothetical protein